MSRYLVTWHPFGAGDWVGQRIVPGRERTRELVKSLRQQGYRTRVWQQVEDRQLWEPEATEHVVTAQHDRDEHHTDAQ